MPIQCNVPTRSPLSKQSANGIIISLVEVVIQATSSATSSTSSTQAWSNRAIEQYSLYSNYYSNHIRHAHTNKVVHFVYASTKRILFPIKRKCLTIEVFPSWNQNVHTITLLGCVYFPIDRNTMSNHQVFGLMLCHLMWSGSITQVLVFKHKLLIRNAPGATFFCRCFSVRTGALFEWLMNKYSGSCSVRRCSQL